jgi:hypothetical protein
VIAQLADGTLTAAEIARQAIDRSPDVIRPAMAASSLDVAAFIDRCLQRLLRNAILEAELAGEPVSEAAPRPAG